MQEIIDPEDIIQAQGIKRETFRDLYANDQDPWFVEGSQAEQLRLNITEWTIAELADWRSSWLDYAAGKNIFVVPGVRCYQYDWAFHKHEPERTFDIVSCLNMLYYYQDPDERRSWRKHIVEFLNPDGLYAECNPIRHGVHIPYEQFKQEFEEVCELKKVIPVVVEWNSREYRDSEQYKFDLMNSKAIPRQVLMVGIKR